MYCKRDISQKTRSYDRVFVDKRNKPCIIIDGGEVVGNKEKIQEINSFLEKAKRLISIGKYDFVPRRTNMQTLAQYGLTIADAKEEILSLMVGDYYKGPKQDFDRPGVVWEFKKKVEKKPFYIKLKVIQENGEDILRCLSFHEDDFA